MRAAAASLASREAQAYSRPLVITLKPNGGDKLRPERAPASAWLAGGLALIAGLLALSANPWSAFLMLGAAACGVWAAVELRRYRIAPRGAQSASGRLEDLAQLLEALPDPALLVDQGSRVIGSNAAALQRMQFKAKGQFLTAILRHPDVLEGVQAAVGQGDTRSIEYESGAQLERHTRCYIAPLTWGDARGAMLVFHDETARVSTERMRADFLANASHELRTPLASLSLLIETIAGPARDDIAERDRFLAMMQVQADRMRRLIDDLLSLSRIELDEHVPPTDRADLTSVAQEVADTLRGVAAERNVRLKLEIPSQRMFVIGERFQLVQVVQNLVDNAVRYSPAGGEVRIEVAAGGDQETAAGAAGRRWEGSGRVVLLTPPVSAGKSYVVVRVEDSGPGIAPRHLPRLGGRFFRVEREMGQEKGGTGLGLAIVKHIVSRHRGGLLVESQPGRGSAFAFYVESAI